MHSILLGVVFIIPSIVLWILSWIPFLGVLFTVIRSLLGIAWLALTIVCIVKSWNGDMYHLPVIGDKAEEYTR